MGPKPEPDVEPGAEQLVERYVVQKAQPEVELEAELRAAPKVAPRVTPIAGPAEVTSVGAEMAVKAGAQTEDEGGLKLSSKPDRCDKSRRHAG